MTESLLERLLREQNADGGWGAHADAPSCTEPTALALMALPADAPARQRATEWLLGSQHAGGSWPLDALVEGPSWVTMLCVLALDGVAAAEPALRRATDWILQDEAETIDWRTRWHELWHGQEVELDWDLRGWPWAVGTFSWVEPTAYALLALKRRRGKQPSHRLQARVHEAERMLRDRACTGGGWNYGNRRVLGQDLEPYPDITAIALLSLQDLPADATITQGFDALQRMLQGNHSGLTLALALLAMRAWRRDAGGLPAGLAAARADTDFLGQTRTLALAAMASSTLPNPFLLERHG